MRKSYAPKMPKGPVSQGYRGYLIQETMHGFAVSHLGFHIAMPATLEAAKAAVDSILD